MLSRNLMLPFIFCGLIILLYIIITIKVHRQIFWYIDSMNIVFSSSYVLCYNCHHPLVFLVLSSTCFVFPMCVAVNCNWGFVY